MIIFKQRLVFNDRAEEMLVGVTELTAHGLGKGRSQYFVNGVSTLPFLLLVDHKDSKFQKG